MQVSISNIIDGPEENVLRVEIQEPQAFAARSARAARGIVHNARRELQDLMYDYAGIMNRVSTRFCVAATRYIHN